MENDKMLNGFEAIFDKSSWNSDEIENIDDNKTVLEDATESLTDEELEALRKGKTDKEDDKVDKEDDNDEGEDDDDNEDVDSKKKPIKPVKNKKSVKEEVIDDEDSDNDDDDSNNTITSFYDVLADQLGWESDENEEKPKTPEELVQYFKDVIEESSVPEYANEDVKKLDEFVRNGGNLRDYFQIDAEIDLDNVEIEDNEDNQKLVLKEFMKESGYSTKQIEKKIAKYEEAGILEDEATDALESLVQIKSKKKEQLLIQQQKDAEEFKAQQQKFLDSVVSEIKGMDSIYGVKIPEKDKKVLLEYIFKPDADGLTKYRKDFDKSRKNLIASAYFMMKGDNLIDLAKKEGKKDALNNFKDSLTKNSGITKRSKRQTINTDDSNSIWESFTRNFRAS